MLLVIVNNTKLQMQQNTAANIYCRCTSELLHWDSPDQIDYYSQHFLMKDMIFFPNSASNKFCGSEQILGVSRAVQAQKISCIYFFSSYFCILVQQKHYWYNKIVFCDFWKGSKKHHISILPFERNVIFFLEPFQKSQNMILLYQQCFCCTKIQK